MFYWHFVTKTLKVIVSYLYDQPLKTTAMKNIDLTTIKNFILTNALNGNVMLMLHPSNFDKLVKVSKNKVKSLCVAGVSIIADDNNEVNEGEIDVLEVKFS
jgi:hypothetical protein